ncbi:MAG: DNA polymerase III subunit gamma/tau [Pseudobdellovibrionaceae bacterium]
MAESSPDIETPDAPAAEYRVLARKYRPSNFSELIGQDALVRTLSNAIESGRIAHAFMLTGIRGTGKTTTARIIAKAINYTGPDGKSGPTTGPTDDCALCRAITEDRHPDVIEMDAASRTGVNDIREIIEGVRYAPVEARYKVYIIDEVHMLSTSAFNALLKTLEEPPPHVKFIFATTEIRKVPITILSRCQRFDLRRVSVDELATHYTNIAALEKAGTEPEAMQMIAQAADGSVRDGLSLLDQAIALGQGKVETDIVRSMLGLNEARRALDLLEHAMGGDVEATLKLASDLYDRGTDPLTLIQDMSEAVHLLTKLKAAPQAKRTVAPNMAEDDLLKASALSAELNIPALGRAWQILLKGTGEAVSSSMPQAVLEMVLIRLCYATTLPDPADLVKKLTEEGGTAGASRSVGSTSSGVGARASSSVSTSMSGTPRTAVQTASAPETAPVAQIANGNLDTLEDIVALLEANGSMILASSIDQYVMPISIKGTAMAVALTDDAPRELSGQLTSALNNLTPGKRWVITIGKKEDAKPTLRSVREEQQRLAHEKLLNDPLVSAVMKTFPGTELL